MSKAGGYIKTGMSFVDKLSGEKPHSSITDWVEVLSSDRYDELSLDGIPELVDSINLQGHQGTTEAARAIRKKLKYGNVHRQLRALVILRALTENAGKGFHLNWANAQIMDRLREMAQDSLLDPKVKKRLILVFHAWSVQYADEPRMQAVAGLYRQYGGGPTVKKPTHIAPLKDSAPVSPTITSPTSRGFSDTDDLYSHSWEPKAGQRGADTYADLAAAKADAEERKRQRETRIAMESREAELERREREFKRKQEMAAIEARRQREAEEEAERRRLAKEELKKRPKGAPAQPKRPKFDFQKEKPQIMVAVATAIQAANNLVNACRHINRETENITESPKVQDNLDKAKAARRTVIRYIQLVTDEEFVGTLLDANEKIVEAIQLYDRLSKPAALDSDSEHEHEHNDEPAQVEAIQRRLAAQRLEADRTGELQQMQERQRIESQRRAARRERRPAPAPAPAQPQATYADLEDLDFGSIATTRGQALPPPLRPDSDAGSYGGGSLSDFSDYDSSDEEWRQAHSRRPSGQYTRPAAATASAATHGYGATSSKGGSSSRRASATAYRSLDDDVVTSRGLLDPNDPFGDPFADEAETQTPQVEKIRMEWAAI